MLSVVCAAGVVLGSAPTAKPDSPGNRFDFRQPAQHKSERCQRGARFEVLHVCNQSLFFNFGYGGEWNYGNTIGGVPLEFDSF